MKRKTGYFLGLIASVLLILTLLITAVEIAMFDRDFYAQKFRALGHTRTIGIEEEDLRAVTDKLLNYLGGNDADLSIRARIGSGEREVFNSREKEHMVDVRALWLFWRMFRNAAACAVVFLGLLIPILMRRDALKAYARSFLAALALLGAVVLGLGIWVSVDFNSFWTLFHHLFFTNDLWILDPAKDILIMMLPAQFFFDIIARILWLFVGAVAVLGGACLIYTLRGAYKRRVYFRAKKSGGGA